MFAPTCFIAVCFGSLYHNQCGCVCDCCLDWQGTNYWKLMDRPSTQKPPDYPLTNDFCTRNILHSPSKVVAKYSFMYMSNTFMLMERHTTNHSSARHLLWCSAAPDQRLLRVSGWNQHFGLLGSRHWGCPTFSWARSWSHMPEYTRQKKNECKWSSSQRHTLKLTFHWELSCTELPLSSAESKSALFFLQPWHPSLP